MKVESDEEVVISLKVRAPRGCFHREHSPHAYALIDLDLGHALRLGHGLFGYCLLGHALTPP